MRLLHSSVVSVLLIIGYAADAAAQSYSIQTPGQTPSYVTPTFGGGYSIQTPGQMPSYDTPT